MQLVAVIMGVAAVSVVWFYFRKAGEARAERFAARAEMDLHQIYESFFFDTGIPEKRVLELWKELADILELPAGRLLPSDRFRVELAPAKGFEFNDPIKDVMYIISRNCQRTGIKPDSIQTIRDYILAFSDPKLNQ